MRASNCKKAGIPDIGILHNDNNEYDTILQELVSGKNDFVCADAVVVSSSVEKEPNIVNRAILKLKHYISTAL